MSKSFEEALLEAFDKAPPKLQSKGRKVLRLLKQEGSTARRNVLLQMEAVTRRVLILPADQPVDWESVDWAANMAAIVEAVAPLAVPGGG